MSETDPRTYAIIGAAQEVHRELGSGFLETVYHEALTLEFQARQIPYQRELVLPIHYKQQLLSVSYRADFICYNEVIVEVKAVDQLVGPHESQLLNYLKATGLTVGLLLNFGTSSLEFKRFIRSRSWKNPSKRNHP